MQGLTAARQISSYVTKGLNATRYLSKCVTDGLTAASVSRVCTWYWCNAIFILSDSQSHIFFIMDVYQSCNQNTQQFP